MKFRLLSATLACSAAALCVALPVCAPSLTPAARAQSTPKVGSADRKKIMDALRVPVYREIKQNVIFKVSHLKMQNGWAFVTAEPLQPNGKPVNYSRTKYAEAVREGFFGGEICALMRRTNGKWKIVNYAIGPTDVAWEGWDRRYGAPSSIFVMN